MDLDLEELIPQPASVKSDVLTLSFPNGCTVTLTVDSAVGCGGNYWPAGEVLATYLAHRGGLNGSKVLELGSGTGLVGLVAAKLGAEVLITDQLPLLNTMEKNIRLNELSGSVTALELNWGGPLPDIPLSGVSLLLAADCVYFEPAFPLLVRTLEELCRPNTEVLFCYKKRRKADKRFFSFLKKKFTWTQVLDDPGREIYCRQNITLLRLKLKPRLE
ncbi:hypothetical protein BS47DRAFT_1489274 [Hydnum rufescens UP504]|uniref:Protein-lysine N-methyltransferase EFM6 n=1 Tax=Hydnum rufescens UP504 TaxID=1448309 RepID=A0A9P6AJ83_9AGAM|nr:hypothetical protein BS47DRAFT_1489274 [Hydnum rufescens UP504]